MSLLDDLGVWSVTLSNLLGPVVGYAVAAFAMGVVAAPGIAGVRWAIRGRTRLTRPTCRGCRSLLHLTATVDGVPQLSERCSECGRLTSAPGAVQWTERGTRGFSLLATMPAALAAALGLAGVVGWFTHEEYLDFNRRAVPLLIKRSMTKARASLPIRLDQIERGEWARDQQWLYDLLLRSDEGSYGRDSRWGAIDAASGATVIERLRAIAGDPDRRLPTEAPRSQSGDPQADLVRTLRQLQDAATLTPTEATELATQLTGPVRLAVQSTATRGLSARVIAMPQRFALRLRVVVDECTFDGEPVITAPINGRGLLGFDWNLRPRADDDGATPALPQTGTLRFRGHFIDQNLGFSANPLVCCPFTFEGPVTIGDGSTPVEVTAPYNPFSDSGGALEFHLGNSGPYRKRTTGWVILRSASAVGIRGVVEIREAPTAPWRTILVVTEPTAMATAHWFRPLDAPLPSTVEIRIRPEKSDDPDRANVSTEAMAWPPAPLIETWNGEASWTLTRYDPTNDDEALAPFIIYRGQVPQ
jgi:hypothetical protein